MIPRFKLSYFYAESVRCILRALTLFSAAVRFVEMKEKKDKKRTGKSTNSSLKAATASAILAGSFLVGAAPVNATDTKRVGTIRERVRAARTVLQEKLAADDSAFSKLSYSEIELTQWGNWGNWGNWNNWRNWNNWNNWANWGNWGNR